MLAWVVSLLLWISSAQGNIHVGAALNIFRSFGDLGSVFQVKGREILWLPEYHFKDVFHQIFESRSPVLSADPDFNGDFLLQLCDDSAQLKAALYQHHDVEGVDRPWRALTGGWSRSMATSRLGVNTSYLADGHGYALVRLVRHHEQVMLSPDHHLYLNQWAEKGASEIIPERRETVFGFIENFGSHFISSYITGDSLHQVFVFSPRDYENLHKAMKEFEKTRQDIHQVLAFFNLPIAEHIGRIVSLSGNDSMEQWAERYLHSNLLTLHSAPELLQTLNLALGDDALLAVELTSLAPYLPDEGRRWFSEVVDNHLKLWELSV